MDNERAEHENVEQPPIVTPTGRMTQPSVPPTPPPPPIAVTTPKKSLSNSPLDGLFFVLALVLTSGLNTVLMFAMFQSPSGNTPVIPLLYVSGMAEVAAAVVAFLRGRPLIGWGFVCSILLTPFLFFGACVASFQL